MFKLNLADALVSYLYPLSPVAVQNLQIHQQGNCVVYHMAYCLGVIKRKDKLDKPLAVYRFGYVTL